MDTFVHLSGKMDISGNKTWIISDNYFRCLWRELNGKSRRTAEKKTEKRKPGRGGATAPPPGKNRPGGNTFFLRGLEDIDIAGREVNFSTDLNALVDRPELFIYPFLPGGAVFLHEAPGCAGTGVVHRIG